jgi:protein O-GlcNAc transferase
MATIDEALSLAFAHHQAGQLDLAEEIYRRVLAVEPRHADALHRLGMVAHQTGRHALAADLIRQAIAVAPAHAAFHNNLGVALKDQGQYAAAIAAYQQALQLQPDDAEVYSNLGNAWRAQGNLDEALACCQRAVALDPHLAQAHGNLGDTLRDCRRFAAAADCYRRAIALQPHRAVFHHNLGDACHRLGLLDEAARCFRQAIALDPSLAPAYNNLGNVLSQAGKLDEAVACYEQAIARAPRFSEAHSNLGTARKAQGCVAQAIQCFRDALHCNPDLAAAHSNLLYTLYFSPDYDAQTIWAEHHRWNREQTLRLSQGIAPHSNAPLPDRRLRIGYVSSDFRVHPVGLFLLPLLEAHERGQFEIYAYSSVQVADAITDRIRTAVDVWRDVSSQTDEQLTQTIRADQIDILVDLGMHMADNRILVFARKPAPVQVTYLAYCGTTGLTAIDYRLTDPYLDPPDMDDRYYSEESVRLPETYWCYRPLADLPPPGPLPQLAAGHVTFGCLNEFSKISEPTLLTWCRLLQAVPSAHLLLHAPLGSARQRVRAVLSAHNIARGRFEFVERLPRGDYFRVYHRIDVALDPFPYGGGTTTCDALWMGVPVVSLVGQTGVGRSGASLLTNVGLSDLLAHDGAQYVEIAAQLAGNVGRLSELRATLRQRMGCSPLTDAARFARHIEAAYRRMWHRWCHR